MKRRGRLARIAPSQEQEILHHDLHSEHLLEEPAQHRTLLAVGGLGHVDLQLGAEPGQRAPQLMGGVGNESLLPADRGLETGQHVVHGRGEAIDLIFGAGSGNPSLKIGGPDLRNLHPDVFYGTQGAADQPPDQGGQSERPTPE